ncbi:MAG: TlpA disulfide reductase family protein [Pseudomonadota bacterium]
MNRRHWLTGGVAVAAATAGAGWALWREQQQAAAQAAGDAELWRQRFDRPDGTLLAMDSLRGRPTLVNFWATWCPPCLQEMPLLNAFHQPTPGSGWQVLGLAVDNVEPVQAYLKRLPVTFPVAIAGFGGLELASSLGNSTRQLPFSVLFNAGGEVIGRKLGAFTEAELAGWRAKAG